GNIGQIPLPEGSSTGAMLLREVILKAQGKWQYPYEHEELCHCRVVATSKVDAAILTGAHDPRDVSKQTSASTACGTCRPDVEAIIAYRLGK
ncbi:MAG: (2Fe-2S)-binding protein, partial [Bdellovibrionales bacterium]|nr:(2Fe-2S)-binding protein [Bdellovibrionales bacterium]